MASPRSAATGGSAGVESRRPVTGGSGALLAVAAVIAAAAGMAWWASRPAPGDPLLHLALPIPASHEIVVGQLPALAVSGDGRTVVYRARQGGVMRLFEHRLTEAGPVVVPGSDDVAGHALSPDGQSVAFVRNGQLFRSVLGGGEPVLVSALSGGATLSWGTPDVIIASGGPGGSLRRVPASGGTAVPFTTVDVALGHMSHGAPQLLPDGHTVLFSVSAADGSHIAVTDLDGGDVVMLTRGREPRLLPSGLLVFARDRSLWVVRFDVASRSLVGEPVQVLDGVERSDLNAFIHFAVSDEGTLFYIPWREGSGLMRLAWHDRQGRELELEHEARGITRFSLSPDGARVALAIADGEDRDVWVLERARKALARLTSDPVPDSQPIWSPDGTLIAFRSDRDGGGVFVRRADGASGVRRLTRAETGFHIPYTFTPDGGRVLFTVFRDYVDQDIASVGVTDLTVEPVLQGKVAEVHPALSPDGRWLLYQADESGRFEVYLRPYPNVADARWQVSVGGGMSPTWRADGRELFFASNGQLMAATFRDGAPPRVGVPETLFPVPSSGDRLGPQFDVSRDGTRVLVLTPTPVDPVADRPQVRIVQRWATELARVVPAS